MKKTVAAALLAVLMLLLCACSVPDSSYDKEDSGDGIVITDDAEIDDGWTTHTQGKISISYPEDDYKNVSVTTTVGGNEYTASFHIKLKNGDSNINILDGVGADITPKDLDEGGYLDLVINSSTSLLEESYENGLGVECTATSHSAFSETRAFGNGKCFCIGYAVDIEIPAYDTVLYIDYYQVVYYDKEVSYTVTFTHFIDDDSTAKEFFGDIIDTLYIK